VSRVFFRVGVKFRDLAELQGLVRHMVLRWRIGAAGIPRIAGGADCAIGTL